jgi:hypothetical protein
LSSKPSSVRRRVLSLCTSLAVAMGFGLFAAHPAFAVGPAGVMNFYPQWTETNTTSEVGLPNEEPSIIVISDKFDGSSTVPNPNAAHLTLVASPDSTVAAWYVCPPGTYGAPGQNVNNAAFPGGSCLQIGQDTTATTPIAPGVGVDKAYEFFWDIPQQFDAVARDVVGVACFANVIDAAHCSAQAETGVIIDDSGTGSAGGASSSGKIDSWCVDVPPVGNGCDTFSHAVNNGTTIPAFTPGGPFPAGSNIIFTAHVSADVNFASLCVDPHADAFDPPNVCAFQLKVTTQAAQAFATAKFSVPIAVFPLGSEIGIWLFEDDDNLGGEADDNGGFCDTGNPVPFGAGGVPDPGEGRECILDADYIVAAAPAPAEVHVTNDESVAPGDQGPTFCQDANRAKTDIVFTGAEDQAIGCVFDQFALKEGTTDQKDPADLLGNLPVTFELTGPGNIDECEGAPPVPPSGSTAAVSCHLENANAEVADNKYEMEWHGTAIPNGAPTATVTITFCYDPEDNGCADAGALQDSLTKTLVAGINHMHIKKTKNLEFHPNCHVGPQSITRRAGGKAVSLTACLHDVFHNFSALDAPLVWRLDTAGVGTGADPARFVGQPDECFGPTKSGCDFTFDNLVPITNTVIITPGALDGTGKAIAKVKAKPRAAGHLTRVFACLDLDVNGECDADQPSLEPVLTEFFGLNLLNAEALMEIHWK